MAKEWILNPATNRFKLNYKRNVGATSESIRKCCPKSLEEWRNYYYANVKNEEHIEELGKKLYVKVTEVLTAEIQDITEDDCINFMKQLVINRTYDGYIREINTIYGQLQEIINVKICPAPDEWDRRYSVDFYIEINEKYIGLQIKPIQNYSQLPEIYKEKGVQLECHRKFTQKYGGKVFYIYSHKQNYKKQISNPEVIDEIKAEIERISTLN